MLTCCLGSGPAQAAAWQIEARTEAQAYELRSYRDPDPANPVLLPRRRIVQYLGVNGYELLTGEDLGFESNVRVYADLGLPRGEAARVDGLRSEGADLLYANVSYRGGGLEARLGRQLDADVMDVMAFDGLKVRYLTRQGLGAEAYAGLWVKGAGFFGSPVSQLDGTRESDARRLALNVPGADPTLDALEPVFGARLLAQGLAGFSGALAYRQALAAGKTDFQRVAAQATWGRGFGLHAFAGADFDLLLLRLAQLRGEVRYDSTVFAVSGEVERLAPVLAADSIWYYFATAPRDEANLRADLYPAGPLRYFLRLTATRYNLDLNPTLQIATAAQSPALPSGLVYGGSAGAALRIHRIRSALDVTLRRGYQGNQLWVDATCGYTPEDGRFTLDGRLSVANVRDAFNPLLKGIFYGAQAWASYALTPAARASLVLEENVNPFTVSEAKAFLLFDLKANL